MIEDDVARGEHQRPTSFDIGQKIFPSRGPSITKGATIRLAQAGSNVITFNAMRTEPTNRFAAGQRPAASPCSCWRQFHRLTPGGPGQTELFARRDGARGPRPAVFCSAACRLFFEGEIVSPEPPKQRYGCPNAPLAHAATISSSVESGCSATMTRSRSACASNGDLLPRSAFCFGASSVTPHLRPLAAELNSD